MYKLWALLTALFVIVITPAAPVIIYTEYGPGEWHSAIYLRCVYDGTVLYSAE